MAQVAWPMLIFFGALGIGTGLWLVMFNDSEGFKVSIVGVLMVVLGWISAVIGGINTIVTYTK